MAYCSIDDLIKDITEASLLQLSDDKRTGEIANAEVVEVIDDAIKDAAEEMDSYLSVRYAMPLDAVKQLKDCNSQLAIWQLMQRRQLGDTDDAKNRRKIKIDWLKEVRNFKANVIGIEDKTGSDSSGNGQIIVKQGVSKNFNWNGY